MKKVVLLAISILSLGAIDDSDRSTQELIAALKNAKGAKVEVILHELKQREAVMNDKEKKAYEEALQRLKSGR